MTEAFALISSRILFILSFFISTLSNNAVGYELSSYLKHVSTVFYRMKDDRKVTQGLLDTAIKNISSHDEISISFDEEMYEASFALILPIYQQPVKLKALRNI